MPFGRDETITTINLSLGMCRLMNIRWPVVVSSHRNGIGGTWKGVRRHLGKHDFLLNIHYEK